MSISVELSEVRESDGKIPVERRKIEIALVPGQAVNDTRKSRADQSISFGWIYQFKKYLDAVDKTKLNDISVAELQCRIGKFEPIYDDFNIVQSELESKLDFSDTEEQERTQFEDDYFLYIGKARLHIDKTPSNSHKSDNISNSSQTSQSNVHENNSIESHTHAVQSESQVMTSHCCDNQVILSTAMVLVKDNQGKFYKARALLDNGSMSNFITEELCKKLGLTTIEKYERMQRALQHFWKRWQREYIAELQSRLKWKTSFSMLLKIDSLVLLKDDDQPPLMWKLGRVTGLHPGTDNIIRVATVKLSNGSEVRRVVSKLCVLPLESDSL
ncbi:hypothetical protein NQ314_005434 [Rhamnusium bicolor]|uniref:DUF5641 domain-containing protein n=1 Tax=Rhamnusium bicolor TaxID=1586634 RepID=A0AAV8ZHG8_9CUCU|nr:hypothetical protein NQ314_005434 [Rhamnusium bicolor]